MATVTLLLAGLARNPATPPGALAAIGTRLPPAAERGHAERLTALALVTNPTTPEEVASRVDLALTRASDLGALVATGRAAGTPGHRIRAAAASAPPHTLAAYATWWCPHPAAASLALHADLAAGKLTTERASCYAAVPDLDPDDLLLVVRHLLSVDLPARVKLGPLTAATRVLPDHLGELASTTTTSQIAERLARYAAAAAAGHDPHAQALRDVRGDADQGSLAATRILLTDPVVPPEQVAADLLTYSYASQQYATVVTGTPYLATTPAGWTAHAIIRRTRPDHVVVTADDVLPAFAAYPMEPAVADLLEGVLPHVTDPEALAGFAHTRRVLVDPAVAWAILLHPVTDAPTRHAAMTAVRAHQWPDHPTYLDLTGNPAALLDLPVPELARVRAEGTPAVLTALAGACTAIAPALSDPAVTDALVGLAPTFTGTIAELATTAGAIAA